MTRVKWQTLGGAILAGLAWVCAPQNLAILPDTPGGKKAAAILTALGMVLSAFGIHRGQAETHALLEDTNAVASRTGATVSQTLGQKQRA